MNHTELSDTVAAALDLSKADGRRTVDAVIAAIVEASAKGEEVSINGFGKFKVKETRAREGRNPATGETIQIKAAKKLTFGAEGAQGPPERLMLRMPPPLDGGGIPTLRAVPCSPRWHNVGTFGAKWSWQPLRAGRYWQR